MFGSIYQGNPFSVPIFDPHPSVDPWIILKLLHVPYLFKQGKGNLILRSFWLMSWSAFALDAIRSIPWAAWSAPASGFSLTFVVLTGLICGVLGCRWGGLCACLLLSQGCRSGVGSLARALLVALQPVPEARPPEEARRRLSGYRPRLGSDRSGNTALAPLYFRQVRDGFTSRGGNSKAPRHCGKWSSPSASAPAQCLAALSWSEAGLGDSWPSSQTRPLSPTTWTALGRAPTDTRLSVWPPRSMRALLVDFSFEQGVLFRKPNLGASCRVNWSPLMWMVCQLAQLRVCSWAIRLCHDAIFGALEPSCRLFLASMAVYRRQWNAVMDRLGIESRPSAAPHLGCSEDWAPRPSIWPQRTFH